MEDAMKHHRHHHHRQHRHDRSKVVRHRHTAPLLRWNGKARVLSHSDNERPWYGDFDDGSNCSDSDIRCYGDNGKNFARQMGGPESSSSCSFVSPWQRLSGREMCLAFSQMQLPRRAFYKSQHTRKKTIISPGSTDDILYAIRKQLCSLVLDDGHRGGDVDAAADVCGEATVKHIQEMLDRRGLLLSYAQCATAEPYREPDVGNSRVGIDIGDFLQTVETRTPVGSDTRDARKLQQHQHTIDSPRACVIGEALGVELLRSGKKFETVFMDQRVLFYFRGRIECAWARSLSTARDVLLRVFTAMQESGVINSACTFEDARMSITRASFSASMGTPVNLTLYKEYITTFLNDQVGNACYTSCDRKLSKKRKIDFLRWTPSQLPSTVVKLDSNGHVSYTQRANIQEPTTLLPDATPCTNAQTTERHPSGAQRAVQDTQTFRDDILKMQYVTLHRNIMSHVLAIVRDIWTAATHGSHFMT